MAQRFLYTVGRHIGSVAQLNSMAQLVFLNELSHPADNLHSAVAADALVDLLEVMLQIRAILPRVALITAVHLPALQLGKSYSVAMWLNDHIVNRDRARFLLSLMQYAPFRVAQELFGDPDPGITVYANGGDVAEGIGLAHLYGGLPISFSIETRWRVAELKLDVQQLLEDGESNWSVDIRHASLIEHVGQHRVWLQSLIRRNIENATDLILNRADFFPRIEFGPGIEADLNKLQPPALLQVAQYLFRLNDAVEAWDPNLRPAPEYPPNTTDESPSRKRLCNFPAPGGGKLPFTWHGRYTPGPGRIHFRIEHNPKRAVLGYIGRKIGA